MKGTCSKDMLENEHTCHKPYTSNISFEHELQTWMLSIYFFLVCDWFEVSDA